MNIKSGSECNQVKQRVENALNIKEDTLTGLTKYSNIVYEEIYLIPFRNMCFYCSLKC